MLEHPSMAATRILECPATRNIQADCTCQDGDPATVARAYLAYQEPPVESYYDASWDLRCDRCNAAATDFHGNPVGRWSADDDAAHAAIVARLRIEGESR